MAVAGDSLLGLALVYHPLLSTPSSLVIAEGEECHLDTIRYHVLRKWFHVRVFVSEVAFELLVGCNDNLPPEITNIQHSGTRVIELANKWLNGTFGINSQTLRVPRVQMLIYCSKTFKGSPFGLA